MKLVPNEFVGTAYNITQRCTFFPLNRSHSDSVHVGRMDDRLRLPGQDSPLLGPASAQLCAGGGHNSARLRRVTRHFFSLVLIMKKTKQIAGRSGFQAAAM